MIFELEVERTADGFVVFIPELSCGGSGATLDEALKELSEDLKSVQKVIVDESDDNLSQDGQELKQKILNILNLPISDA